MTQYNKLHPCQSKASFPRMTLFALLVINALFGVAVAGTICRPLVLPETVSVISGEYHLIAEGQLGGTEADDIARIEFYNFDVGTFDLADLFNENYASCNQCVLLYQDSSDPNSSKIFYQDQGELTIASPPGTDPLPVVFNNLRLVEVTIANDFTSTPVPGGACYVGVNDVIFLNGFEN